MCSFGCLNKCSSHCSGDKRYGTTGVKILSHCPILLVLQMFDLQALYYTAVYGSEIFSPFTEDPITVYEVVLKCSNDPITADNPVYGVRIGVTT